MMEQDREDLCGPRWKRDPERKAGRTGTTRSEVTLGGRRIPITRPRARSRNGQELMLPSFAFAASRDPLDRHTLDLPPVSYETVGMWWAAPPAIEERFTRIFVPVDSSIVSVTSC